MEGALLELESDLADEDGVASSFEWYGKSIPCVPTSLQRSVAIAPDGNETSIEARIFARTVHFITADLDEVTSDSDEVLSDDFSPFPKSGHTLTFRGQAYRVAWARLSGPQSHVEIALESLSF